MSDCDNCGNPYDKRYYVTTPRPSDQTELVSVLWICESCAKISPCSGDYRVLDSEGIADFFDSGEAAKVGIIFNSTGG